MLFFKEMLKPHSAPHITNTLTSPKVPQASGYLEQYQQQQQRKLEYKAYTLDDYRKLKNETNDKLGMLGPDLDSDAHKERVCYVSPCLSVSQSFICSQTQACRKLARTHEQSASLRQALTVTLSLTGN